MGMDRKISGRPMLPPDERRRNRVTFCLTDAELNWLRTEAEQNRISMSVLMRLKLIASNLITEVSNG